MSQDQASKMISSSEKVGVTYLLKTIDTTTAYRLYCNSNATWTIGGLPCISPTLSKAGSRKLPGNSRYCWSPAPARSARHFSAPGKRTGANLRQPGRSAGAGPCQERPGPVHATFSAAGADRRNVN